MEQQAWRVGFQLSGTMTPGTLSDKMLDSHGRIKKPYVIIKFVAAQE